MRRDCSKRFGDRARAILLWMALVAAVPGVSSGWNVGITLNPWETEAQHRENYLLYNNTNVRVFVYHDKTGMKYTMEPGESGYLSIGQDKLKFNPREIRCGFENSCGECVVRLAPFGITPLVVVEAVDTRSGHYAPQATAAPDETPRYEHRPIRTGQPDGVGPRNAAYRLEPKGVATEGPAPVPRRPEADLRPGERAQAGDPAELLKSFMERMVHIYHRSRGEDRARQIADLKLGCQGMLGGMLSEDLRLSIERYEAVCRCIGDQAASGMSLEEIFRSKRCSDRSTKDLRSEIISGFKRQIKQ